MSNYSTGTVSVTNGDATVTGSGTLWSTNVAAGDLFTIVASGVVYEVASVTDDTNLELTATYAGTSDSSLSYTIVTSFTSPDDIPYPEQGDIETASIVKRLAARVQELFTGLAALAQTLTNKTISLTDNTLSGTTAEFNTALSDGDFATLAGTEELTNKTITSPDINGGTADDLTSLSVAADSDGNVSRYVLSTTTATAAYYAKLATFSFPATNNVAANLSILLTPKSTSGTYAPVVVTVTALQGTSGLSTDSKIQVLSSDETAIAHDDLFLDTATATNETDIDLWMQSVIAAAYDVVLLSSSFDTGVSVSSYNDGATWQAGAPSGAVTVTSDWAGSGWIAPTFLNGWATLTGSEFYYRKDANGGISWVGSWDASGATTANGTVVFTFPVGYRPYKNVRVMLTSKAATDGADGLVEIGTDGDVVIYGFNTGNPGMSAGSFKAVN